MAQPFRAVVIVIRALWLVTVIVGLSGYLRAREPGRPYRTLLVSYSAADSPAASPFTEWFRQAVEQRTQAHLALADVSAKLLRGARKLYKWEILLGIAVIILEAGLLAFLLKFIIQHRHDEEVLRDLSGRLINAQEEERRRIARELHDDINQQLAVLAIELQSLEAAVPQLSRLQLKERLRLLWNKTNSTSQDLQHISHRLHPSKLEFLGLEGALRGLGKEFKQTSRIQLDLQIRTVPNLVDKDVSLTFFRVAQEALHNSGKHSNARHVRLEFFTEKDDVVLRVSDDGIGFDVSAVEDKSLGILSMEERLRLVRGRLMISAHPGAGTRIEARVPLAVSAAQHKAAS